MNYKVADVKLWGVSKGSTDLTNAVKDDSGNYLMSLTLEEAPNEPVDFRSVKVPQVGDVIKGEIKDYTSSKGNDRKFLAVDEGTTPNQKYIQAQWSIGQALIYAPDHQDLAQVEEYARALIEMANKIAEEA